MNDRDPWLDARLTEAPEGLREAVQRATRRVQRGGEVPAGAAQLRDRAEELLAKAANGPATPDTAATLLAADALMTLACEWIAEHQPERLRD